ncbi:MAG: hypothetical protein P8M34_09215 [Saprospiraceae bacterium]|nr:hypothetical protein [Saprospiraceae bacterium]|tara:strand:- start:640 stop:2103 length:1464 start_codon:yes stop_codon:yes gene_type:complete
MSFIIAINNLNTAMFRVVNCSTCSVVSNLEYFIDTDPGYGAATSLSAPSSLNFSRNYTISLGSISPGIHTLYIRAKNENGDWSFTQKRSFYVFEGSSSGTSDLDYLEYFIDTDPGYDNGNPLGVSNGTESDANYTINLTGINLGIHTLYVRAKNKNGVWSFIQKRSFYVFDGGVAGTSELDYLEYFIDADPGYDNGEPLGVSNSTDSDANYTIDLNGLAPGIHTLYVRAKNQSGLWSFIQKRMFYVFEGSGLEEPEIVEIEYYIDDEPGLGNASKIAFTPDDTVEVNLSLNAADFTGNNFIYVRAKDNYGRWSFTVRDTLNWTDNMIDLMPRTEQQASTGDPITNIEWDTINNVEMVNVDLVTRNGEFVRRIAINVDPGSNIASWVIPVSVPDGEYKIKVYDSTEPTIFDISSNTINITAVCMEELDIRTQDEIYGEYKAEMMIMSDGRVEGLTPTLFSSPNIELDGGFEVPLGALFEAMVEGCNND